MYMFEPSKCQEEFTHKLSEAFKCSKVFISTFYNRLQIYFVDNTHYFFYNRSSSYGQDLSFIEKHLKL